MINVSNAATFSEFVGEIRDGHSEIVIAPEYSIPLPSRQLASIAQILGNYQHFPDGRKLWSERVYFDGTDGDGLKTLAEHWNGREPLWTRIALRALAVLSHPLMRPVIGFAVGDTDIGRDESRGNTVAGTIGIATGGLQPE
jgi:hypothetical protein